MKSTVLKKPSFTLAKKYAALFVVVFVGGLMVFFEHFNEEPLAIEDLRVEKKFDREKSDVGYLAPGFTLRDLNGNHDALSNYKGQVVVLNFWATWCVPCRVEMPHFEALYRRFRSEGLTVLAVSLDKGDQRTDIQKFVDEYELSFPVLLDPKGDAEKLYPAFSIPYTFVIDKDGRVVARVDGAKNWQSRETFEAIEHLLKKV